MDKRVLFPINNAKARDTFFVNEDRSYLVKHAGNYHPEIQKYIERAKPIKDMVQVLLTALGAYEDWGQNVNGDRFRRTPLKNPGEDYGYRTFVTNANYFNHHVNKDPLLSKGKVLCSVWNDKSKRVELVVGIDVNKDPEGAASASNGETLAFSMGCKTPYDTCSICSNKAKNRSEYCDHLKYMMNQIDPASGELVGADNPYPKFFDISRVLIPADKTAYMWTKIAGAANHFDGVPSAFIAEAVNSGGDFMQKVASYREEHKKSATITKRINLAPHFAKLVDETLPRANAMREKMIPQLPKEAVDKLAELPLDQVLSTFAGMGMMPTKQEFDRLVIRFIITNKDKMHAGFEEMDTMVGNLIRPECFNDSIAEAISPMMPDRAMLRPFLLQQLLKVKEMLDAKDPQATKIAEDLRSLNVESVKPANPPVTPATIVGLIAVMYALATQHAAGGALGGLGSFIKDNPFLALALGAGAMRGVQVASQKPAPVGMYDVDDPNRSFYTNDWQSRFARMQARPVSVIKTGSLNKQAVDDALFRKVYYGVPAVLAAGHIAKAKNDADPRSAGPVSKFIGNHPKAIASGMLMHHVLTKKAGAEIAGALDSVSRLLKTASIADEEFLGMLPDEDYIRIADLAILQTAKEINDSVLGGT